jgi:hypothetical protein
MMKRGASQEEGATQSTPSALTRGCLREHIQAAKAGVTEEKRYQNAYQKTKRATTWPVRPCVPELAFM